MIETMQEQQNDSPLIYLPEQNSKEKKIDFMEKFESILKLNLDGVSVQNKKTDSVQKVGFDRVLSNDRKIKDDKSGLVSTQSKQTGNNN